MKIKAIVLAVLMLAAMTMLFGCKDESMLDNYSSDTFELGEADPISVDDFDIGSIDIGEIDLGDIGDIDIGTIDLGDLF